MTNKTTKNGNTARPSTLKANVAYVDALKSSIDTLANAIAEITKAGYAVSAKISYGRLMSVSVSPAVVRRGRPPIPHVEADEMDVETDCEEV